MSQRRTTTQPDDPRDFCAALLSVRTYALPPEVDTLTWRVALRHFARTNPTDLEFRRLLERRAALPADRDAGGRVAAVLLREWERYGVARLLSADAPLWATSGAAAHHLLCRAPPSCQAS